MPARCVPDTWPGGRQSSDPEPRGAPPAGLSLFPFPPGDLLLAGHPFLLSALPQTGDQSCSSPGKPGCGIADRTPWRQQEPRRVRAEQRASAWGSPAFSPDWDWGWGRRSRAWAPRGAGLARPRVSEWGADSPVTSTAPPIQTTRRRGGNSFTGSPAAPPPRLLAPAARHGLRHPGNWSSGVFLLWAAAAGTRGPEASGELLLHPEWHLGAPLAAGGQGGTSPRV